jgi:hypothetical protein
MNIEFNFICQFFFGCAAASEKDACMMTANANPRFKVVEVRVYYGLLF